jgi:hypothetical protein
MKKVFIKSEENNFQISIIGIASVESDYKMAWLLNNRFGVELAQKEENVILETSDCVGFSYFFYQKSEEYFYILVNNRASNSILSSKNKNLDFFLYIVSSQKGQIQSEILSELKKFKEIRTAFKIKNDKILDKIPDIILKF